MTERQVIAHLVELIIDIINSEDDTGCTEDLTVVSKSAVYAAKDFVESDWSKL